MKSFILTLGICLASFVFFAQEQLYFNALYVPFTDATLVYTPKDYSMTSSRKYTVMFLPHGYGVIHRQWNTIVNVQKYTDAYGFIIVCPDGLKCSWYINSPRKKMSKFEDFYLEIWFLPLNKNIALRTTKFSLREYVRADTEHYIYSRKDQTFSESQ